MKVFVQFLQGFLGDLKKKKKGLHFNLMTYDLLQFIECSQKIPEII